MRAPTPTPARFRLPAAACRALCSCAEPPDRAPHPHTPVMTHDWRVGHEHDSPVPHQVFLLLGPPLLLLAGVGVLHVPLHLLHLQAQCSSTARTSSRRGARHVHYRGGMRGRGAEHCSWRLLYWCQYVAASPLTTQHARARTAAPQQRCTCSHATHACSLRLCAGACVRFAHMLCGSCASPPNACGRLHRTHGRCRRPCQCPRPPRHTYTPHHCLQVDVTHPVRMHCALPHEQAL